MPPSEQGGPEPALSGRAATLAVQVTEFQAKLRVAEIEKSNLEAEVQSLRDQMAQRKAEADRRAGWAGAGGNGCCVHPQSKRLHSTAAVCFPAC